MNLRLAGWILGCMLWVSPTWAESHRGSVGLLVMAHGASRSLGQAQSQIENSWAFGPELGLTLSFDERGNEIKTSARMFEGGSRREWEAFVGRRGYFGDDEFKTFLDLDVAVQWAPVWTAGPRVAFGFQYELSPVIGTFGALGIQLGFGQELRFVAGLTMGLQFRSYLLE